MPIQLIAAGVALALAFAAGWTVNGWRFDAERRTALEQRLQSIQVDQARVEGVASGYEQIREELRAIERGKHTEVIRETNRVEYRCELPADGERLRIDRIRAANAAAGFPDDAVPSDPADAGEGSRGSVEGLHRPGDDVR